MNRTDGNTDVNWITPSHLRWSLYVMLIMEVVFSLCFHVRQYFHITSHLEVPEIVRSVGRGLYTNLDFTLAQDDALNKIIHRTGKKIYMFALWMVAIYFNCIFAAWSFAKHLSFIWPDMISREVARNMSFTILCYFSYEILMLPVYYHYMVMEARRFGLYFYTESNQLIKYLKKLVTSLIPVGFFTGMLSWAIMVLEKKSVYSQVAAIISLTFLFVILYPTLEIWWLIEGAREDRRHETDRESILRINLKALSDRVGFPSKHLIMVKSDITFCSAFYYGFLWFRRILVTYHYRSVRDTNQGRSGDDSQYERIYPTIKEIESIVAHELGHWFHSHSDKSLILWHTVHISSVVLTYWLRSSTVIYSALGFPMITTPSSTVPSNVFQDGVTYAPGIMIVYWLILRLFHSVFETLLHLHQHFCEQEADTFAAELGYKDELGTGLLKIILDQQIFPSSDKWYSVLYNNHPCLLNRLRILHNHPGDKRRQSPQIK